MPLSSSELSAATGLDRSVSATFDNGLRVLAVEDRTVPAVAVNLWYRVGSRDEITGRTGLAHLFEHLMFQGSAQVPAGDHAGLLLDCGASFNATTSFERTNYFETVPTGALRLALWLEADRMATLPRALTQASFDAQRDVVRNERRQRFDNVPYGTAFERLVAALFGTDHPYGHMPIGSMTDLADASLQDALAFFARHYAPGNAVLTVIGDVAADAALDTCAEYFGPVPGGPPVAGPVITPQADVAGAREIVAVENVPADALFLGFLAPAFGTVAYDEAGLALSMFADGTGSPLYQRLVRGDGLATSVSAGLIPLTYASSVGVIHVEVADGADPARVREVLLAEWREFVSRASREERHLARSVALAERAWLEEMSTLAGRADAYSLAVTFFGDPARALDRRQRLAAVTPSGVVAAADALAVDQQHVALTYLREDGPR